MLKGFHFCFVLYLFLYLKYLLCVYVDAILVSRASSLGNTPSNETSTEESSAGTINPQPVDQDLSPQQRPNWKDALEEDVHQSLKGNEAEGVKEVTEESVVREEISKQDLLVTPTGGDELVSALEGLNIRQIHDQ